MVMGLVNAVMFSLQGHVTSIVENLTVFKLSLEGTLRQERRESTSYTSLERIFEFKRFASFQLNSKVFFMAEASSSLSIIKPNFSRKDMKAILLS